MSLLNEVLQEDGANNSDAFENERAELEEENVASAGTDDWRGKLCVGATCEVSGEVAPGRESRWFEARVVEDRGDAVLVESVSGHLGRVAVGRGSERLCSLGTHCNGKPKGRPR